MSRGASVRAAAARAVAEVAGAGRSLDEALPRALSKLASDRDRALCQAIAYGALRRYPRHAIVLAELLSRPLKPGEHRLAALLHVGLVQISDLDVPDHAAVAATVDAVRLIGRPGARGLVNAVLRRFLRERTALLAAADETDEGRYAHPGWMIERLRRAWPEDWEAILAANDRRPPMWLRVNRLRSERAAWQALLSDQEPVTSDFAPAAVCLSRPVDVDRLPGFREGAVSVQDAGAQLAAQLLAPRAGERILDACAAPGGKTGHLLELAPDAAVTALDASATRLRRVEENLERLGLAARCVSGDAGEPAGWWDGAPFDAILLDAPCTASGVVRRHPDIKLLRREADVPQLAREQARLLAALWPLLAPAGRLLYVTCSVFPEEGDEQIVRFLRATPDARRVPPAELGEWGVARSAGRQLLPGATATDGFYYACLVKRL
jgi:16S rRNA (cytosine967-C5)-methyltransferase